MLNYRFNDDIYPKDITYNHPNYMFNYFTNKEQIAEFFKYLFFRIKESYELYKKGEDGFINVILNNNNNYPLIDLEYNFFIKVLSEWVEHYCHKDFNEVEFRRYKIIDRDVIEDGKEKTVEKRTYRDFKMNISIAENVRLDYSYSGWMKDCIYRKKVRYHFAQTLFNGLHGKYIFVSGYQYINKARPVSNFLVKDSANKYYFFSGISFFKSVLADVLRAKDMKFLNEISLELTKVADTKRKISKALNEARLSEDDAVECNSFSIDENRDMGDGIYHDLAKKSDDNE